MIPFTSDSCDAGYFDIASLNPNMDVVGKVVINVRELVFVPSVEHSHGGYFELYFGLRDTEFVKLELSQERRWRCTNVSGCTRIMLNPNLSITDEMLCWNPENDQVPIITRKENAME
ncbi:uncharacterized protein LOC9323042 [Arabidopsis lyrata subsp. lyrata]|uniref:uncharacterized protein LOC9323042 n=1 Tax=Arabidopsis lyrata subsp. lyrata TaxID=81972 RepID=UPI000A29BFB4|nr:uncharacterized protein LOC9323042 [Arabidopsis lyrata subsp. lyrata]|eukprot:XP_020865700.1 uncharacterized protein LOC9323042 [Arabidopsis lyrata subsp. lyrata]